MAPHFAYLGNSSYHLRPPLYQIPLNSSTPYDRISNTSNPLHPDQPLQRPTFLKASPPQLMCLSDAMQCANPYNPPTMDHIPSSSELTNISPSERMVATTPSQLTGSNQHISILPAHCSTPIHRDALAHKHLLPLPLPNLVQGIHLHHHRRLPLLVQLALVVVSTFLSILHTTCKTLGGVM